MNLQALKLMLKKHNTIIENHYLGTVIKTNQFDTFIMNIQNI